MLWFDLKEIKKSSPLKRQNAIRKLCHSENPKVVKAIIDTMRDEDADVRLTAVKHYYFQNARFREEHHELWREGFLTIIYAMDDLEEKVRRYAERKLASFFVPPDYVDDLLRVFKRENNYIESRIKEMLGPFNTQEFNEVRKAIQKKKKKEQRNLEKVKKNSEEQRKNILKKLLEELNSKFIMDQISAADGLGNLGNPDAIFYLKKAFDDRKHEMYSVEKEKFDTNVLQALLKLGSVEYVKENCPRGSESKIWGGVESWRKYQRKKGKLPE